MYNVVVADDETIIRTSITTLVNWEALGFKVIGDAINGKGVLSIVENSRVDVVITDIKMPIMDGIELIKQLQLRENPPLIIVLSAYNDFMLVRSAFKLGAIDYILKSDINESVLKECILNLKGHLEGRSDQKEHLDQNFVLSVGDPEKVLRELVLGKREIQAGDLPENYRLVCFEVEDFERHSNQFGNDMQGSFVQPITNFAKQIPRVASKCIFTSISPSRYIVCYKEKDEGYEVIVSITQQIMNVWKNYMNISVSAGVSSMGYGEEMFFTCLQEAYDCLSMKVIFGRGRILTPLNYSQFDVKQAIKRKKDYEVLINRIKLADNDGVLEARLKFFTSIASTMTLKEAQMECLNVIYHIGMMFLEGKDTTWNSSNADLGVYVKVTQLEEIRDIEMWMINFIRRTIDYIEHQYDNKSMDMIEQAKAFIADHYSDPSISLGAVAEFVDLSEKYFSTRFRKETGISFVTYLTHHRIKKAQEMIENTNMRMYEISEAVGYGSVEHFTRVFKKIAGITPSAYVKSGNVPIES